MKSGLYIVATPIGNLGDISPRAVETLRQADVIACEDSRVTKKLFSLLGISLQKKFITLHDHNEEEQAQVIDHYPEVLSFNTLAEANETKSHS